MEKAKRDFLYVNDVADLYCTIAENVYKNKKELKGEIFNAGTNQEKTVRSVVEHVFSIIGNDKELKELLNHLIITYLYFRVKLMNN